MLVTALLLELVTDWSIHVRTGQDKLLSQIIPALDIDTPGNKQSLSGAILLMNMRLWGHRRAGLLMFSISSSSLLSSFKQSLTSPCRMS